MATARMPQPTADDPVKVDPKHYTVEFENDRVRVVRIKYKAGEKSVMHSHPESVAVFLTDAHAKFTYPDGKSEDIKAKAGSTGGMVRGSGAAVNLNLLGACGCASLATDPI